MCLIIIKLWNFLRTRPLRFGFLFILGGFFGFSWCPILVSLVILSNANVELTCGTHSVGTSIDEYLFGLLIIIGIVLIIYGIIKGR